MSARTGRSAAASPTPWWLEEEEPCPHCAGLHAYGLGLRCEVCDEVTCSWCAVRERAAFRVLCPACASDVSEPARKARRATDPSRVSRGSGASDVPSAPGATRRERR